jgi:SPP1 gp7 family putative phage head morphogenesis protein
MVVGAPITDTGYAALVADGEEAYRYAIAKQVQGVDATAEWDRWETVTAALFLVSWASGALTSAQAAGVPLNVIAAPAIAFAREDDEMVYQPPSRTEISSITLQFSGGPAREVVERFIRLLPLTREKWEQLIRNAYNSAGEVREDEAANALKRIMERSPDLSDLILGKTRAQVIEPPADAPDSVRVRRDPTVQASVQGSFFVTGMTMDQITATKDILAQAIRGDETISVAGKRVEEMGVGDFVAFTLLETASTLTEARLETVYRTNINRAQSQGRLDICRDSMVKRFVPLMRFRSTKDKRTRETHRKFNGFLATVDQIDAMGIPTPLGFNCRCSWTPVPISTAVSEGWCDENGSPNFEAIRKRNGALQQLVDNGSIPDAGFISG